MRSLWSPPATISRRRAASDSIKWSRPSFSSRSSPSSCLRVTSIALSLPRLLIVVSIPLSPVRVEGKHAQKQQSQKPQHQSSVIHWQSRQIRRKTCWIQWSCPLVWLFQRMRLFSSRMRAFSTASNSRRMVLLLLLLLPAWRRWCRKEKSKSSRSLSRSS